MVRAGYGCDSKPYAPRPFPQVIGHRGYKSAFPENTMAAFRGAVEVGADGIETDLHLSKDGIVVLLHDSTLSRCFGKPGKVADYEWDELKALRTLRKPSEPMPRLVDLLRYVTQPGVEHIWLLLDIKRDDNVHHLYKSLIAAIASVPATSQPWEKRIMLGAWDAKWVGACLRYLPGFPVVLLTPSPAHASTMLVIPDIHFGLLNYSFATGRGAQFISRARRQQQHGRMIFSWSDNVDQWMARSIHNGFDGVITDDPKRFIELRSHWDNAWVRERAGRWTLRELIFWLGINIVMWITETFSPVTGLNGYASKDGFEYMDVT